MATKKTIAVVGATGAQGGGLARAILNDPDAPFEVRALTRNPRSDKATNLHGGSRVPFRRANPAGSVRGRPGHTGLFRAEHDRRLIL